MLVVEQMDIPTPALAVWELVRDSTRLPEWFAGIECCVIDGDVRMCTTRNGHTIRERLTIEESAMRLQYSVIDGLPLDAHASFVQVIETSPGARVLYVTWTEPDAAAERLRTSMASALQNLKTNRLVG